MPPAMPRSRVSGRRAGAGGSRGVAPAFPGAWIKEQELCPLLGAITHRSISSCCPQPTDPPGASCSSEDEEWPEQEPARGAGEE